VRLVGNELFEKGPTVENIGAGSASGTLDAAVGTDNQPSPGRAGDFEHSFNDGVGLRMRTRVVNRGTVNDFMARPAGCSGAVADDREASPGVPGSVDEPKELLDLNPGKAGREDPSGVEHVVTVDEDHVGG
jgi:hypothetical protein